MANTEEISIHFIISSSFSDSSNSPYSSLFKASMKTDFDVLTTLFSTKLSRSNETIQTVHNISRNFSTITFSSLSYPKPDHQSPTILFSSTILSPLPSRLLSPIVHSSLSKSPISSSPLLVSSPQAPQKSSVLLHPSQQMSLKSLRKSSLSLLLLSSAPVSPNSSSKTNANNLRMGLIIAIVAISIVIFVMFTCLIIRCHPNCKRTQQKHRRMCDTEAYTVASVDKHFLFGNKSNDKELTFDNPTFVNKND